VDVPLWALSLSYWLHLLGTVAWIGGLAAVTLFFIPAARRITDPDARSALLTDIQRKLDPVAWFSLVLLTGTGMMQMASNPNYDGFLAFTNNWALAILLKHIVFLGMIALSAYATWGVLPAVQRSAMLQAKGKPAPDAEKLQTRSLLILRLNLILGVVVLVFTAMARAAA
jgi:uncharacterized membrane protein